MNTQDDIPPLQWQDHLVMWFRTYILEYRKQIIIGVSSAICMILLIGLFFHKKESSSLQETYRAEQIVDRFQTGSISDSTSYEKDLKELQLLAQSSSIANRFSGIIAQEELLQHMEKFSSIRFEIAEKDLIKNHLSLYAQLVQTIQRIEFGSTEALDQLSNIEQQGSSYPQLQAYALLLKAALLREQGKSNVQEIEKINTLLTTNREIRLWFETILSNQNTDFLSFLQSTG